MQEKSERTVVLAEVDNETAKGLLSQQPSFGNVGEAILKFTTVTGYTNFRAEYALNGSNIVVHFFETIERPWSNSGYWRDTFPAVLDKQGQEHFQAAFPRLKARITEEMKSWWFSAQNYDHLLNLDEFMTRFFDKLDSQIDAMEPVQ